MPYTTYPCKGALNMVAFDTPNRSQMSAVGTSGSFISACSSGMSSSSKARGRPPTRPRSRAALRPATVGSRPNSLSNSASAPQDTRGELPLGRGRIDPFSQRDKVDAFLFEGLHFGHKVFQRAPEAIQTPNDKGIPVPEGTDALL